MLKEDVYIDSIESHNYIIDTYNKLLDKHDYMTIRLIFEVNSGDFRIEYNKNHRISYPEQIVHYRDNIVNWRNQQIEKIIL